MNEIYLGKREDLTYFAYFNDGKIQNLFLNKEENAPKEDEIYKARVTKIVKALKCAFVDLGYEKQGYLYLHNSMDNLNLKKDDEVLVQVIKEEKDSKGAKVSTAISLAGKYCVIESKGEGIFISPRIDNKEYIDKVKKELLSIKDVTITVRTAAEQVSIETLKEEADSLHEKLKDLYKDFNFYKAPKKLSNEDNFLKKIINDMDLSKMDIIYADEKEISAFEKVIPNEIYKLKDKINILKEDIFFSKVFPEIYKLIKTRIYLKSGGYIVIEKTEAFWSIDVNSYKNISSSNIEKTAFITNKEAAYEIGRQIVLRNLSGIIIVDFIDMSKESYKEEILRLLNLELSKGKGKAVVYPHTALNLVQITRTRRGADLKSIVAASFNKNQENKLNIYFFINYIKYLQGKIENIFEKQYNIIINPIYADYAERKDFIELLNITMDKVRIIADNTVEIAKIVLV